MIWGNHVLLPQLYRFNTNRLTYRDGNNALSIFTVLKNQQMLSQPEQLPGKDIQTKLHKTKTRWLLVSLLTLVNMPETTALIKSMSALRIYTTDKVPTSLTGTMDLFFQ